MNDKQELTAALTSNIKTYSDKLNEAEKTYTTALKHAVAKTRVRYRENDEKIKTTLRAIKNSGLGLLDVEHLIANITA